MLGENHSLLADFPEFTDRIKLLIDSDDVFSRDNDRYTKLDKEIRVLELNGAPIDDDEMVKLKSERAMLKDALYQTLLKS